MRKNMLLRMAFALVIVASVSSFLHLHRNPVLYIIGDSTVRNGDGSGKNLQWGWGSLISQHFDTVKISIKNHAIGGRSSRTFMTDGRWDKIMETLQPGDFVIMQFGHNDGAALDDTARARGTIRGIGDESKEIYNPIRKQQEVVYTYGWYMKKYINDTKSKGATPIVCSFVPRNIWQDGKIKRSTVDYGLWSKQVAEQTGTFFIDLYSIVANQYDALGTEKVAPLFYGDHTHTSKDGAILNAASVAGGIKDLKDCKLSAFLK